MRSRTFDDVLGARGARAVARVGRLTSGPAVAGDDLNEMFSVCGIFDLVHPRASRKMQYPGRAPSASRSRPMYFYLDRYLRRRRRPTCVRELLTRTTRNALPQRRRVAFMAEPLLISLKCYETLLMLSFIRHRRLRAPNLHTVMARVHLAAGRTDNDIDLCFQRSERKLTLGLRSDVTCDD
ncbi:hypothetical protein EVAR_51759_1 [Eumeta japonica]|uniref:Uncharacterized protein n=1 Tax=Eumeta variegata TaxID=151549 RepID=A0A4C1XEX1_EUMVA|nr:hypothetical protein EVAR_51759_1 [Eumeta japonica]